MKQYQTVYCGKEAFRKTVTQWKSHASHALIHLFADGADPAEVTAACDILDELMPHAVYVGASASGCIYDGRVSNEKLVISCMLLKGRTALRKAACFLWKGMSFPLSGIPSRDAEGDQGPESD